MNDQMEFEGLLHSILHEVANPEPTGGMEQSVIRSCRISPVVVIKDAALQMEETRTATTDELFAAVAQEENIFVSLWHGLSERFFPRRLPPLILESHPIPVIEKMASDQGYSSAAYAFAVHAFVIFLIGFVVRAQIRETDPVREVTPLTDPPVLRIVARASAQMGGGGGQRGDAPVSKGRLPKLADQQIVPPKSPPLDPPRIAMEPTVVVQQDLRLADNVMPNVGMPNSPLPGVSMGDGQGTGIGPGSGPGVGPGRGGNTGGGVKRVGGSVSMPEVIYSVDPEFSEEARKSKVSGDVTVYLWVDEHGNPTHVRVIRGMGMGLDEKAVEAVKQYKFKPAMENGKPVPVEMYIVVNFQIL